MKTVQIYSVLFFLLSAIITLPSCSTSSEGRMQGKETGYKKISLGDSFEQVLRKVPYIQPAPDNVAKALPKGYKEYYTVKETSFSIENLKFNPSIFYRFNEKDELIYFQLYYIVENPTTKYSIGDAIKRLEGNQINGIAHLYSQPKHRSESANILRKLEIDLSGNGFFILDYKVEEKAK